jgi:hypothetical protein
MTVNYLCHLPLKYSHHLAGNIHSIDPFPSFLSYSLTLTRWVCNATLNINREELQPLSEEGELTLPPVLDSKKRSASHASLSVPTTPLSPATSATVLSRPSRIGVGSGHMIELSTASTVAGSTTLSAASSSLSSSASSSRALSSATGTPLMQSPAHNGSGSGSSHVHAHMTNFGGSIRSTKSVTRRKSARWASQSALATNDTNNTLDHYTRSPPVSGRRHGSSNGNGMARSSIGTHNNGIPPSPPSSHRGNVRSPMIGGGAERGRLPSFASAPASTPTGSTVNVWASPRHSNTPGAASATVVPVPSPSHATTGTLGMQRTSSKRGITASAGGGITGRDFVSPSASAVNMIPMVRLLGCHHSSLYVDCNE